MSLPQTGRKITLLRFASLYSIMSTIQVYTHLNIGRWKATKVVIHYGCHLELVLTLCPVFKANIEDLTEATEDDLKEFFRTEVKYSFRNNGFLMTFASLAEAMATRPALIPGTTGLQRTPSPGSDLSASSDEDKAEESSKQALSHFFYTLLNTSGYARISAGGIDFDLNVYGSGWIWCNQMTNSYRHVSHRQMKIPLGNMSEAVVVENNGGIYLTRQGMFTGSNRFGKIPLLSLEVSIPFKLRRITPLMRY